MALKAQELKRTTRLSFSAGFMGVFWFVVCNPQQIWSIFLQEHLGINSTKLGFVIGLTQFTAVFHLFSIFFYSLVSSRKRFWFITTLLQRSLAFVIAWAAFYAAGGGALNRAFLIISAATILHMVFGNSSASGWFAWMDELIPTGSRASFFGKRSGISQMATVISFFVITLLLDLFSERIFIVYGMVYLVSGIAGTADILLHHFIPESQEDRIRQVFSFEVLFAPLKDRVFLKYGLIMGFNLMSLNIIGPFVAPWIVSEGNGLGVSNLWIGITVVISQLAWVLVAGFWGKVMDRIGKKSVVMIGSLFPLCWVILIFTTPSNYFYLLPLTYLLVGILSAAFFDGILQMTFHLSTPRYRTSYVAWHWTLFGLFGAIGPILGGRLLDATASLSTSNSLFPGGISVNILISAALSLVGLVFYLFLAMNEKPVGEAVRIILNPGIFRTLNSMAYIQKKKTPTGVVEGSLRKIGKRTGQIALPEVIDRLSDPKRSVREEAAKTLGRIGTEEAVSVLIDELKDESSAVRTESARALSDTGSRRAIPHLIKGLTDESDDLKEACAEALAELDEEDSVESLTQLLEYARSEKVKVSGALALSKKGRKEAAEDILRLKKQSGNKVFKKQLAIGLANILGTPGEFYSYVKDYPKNADETFLELVKETTASVRKLIKKSHPRLYHHLARHVIPGMKKAYAEDEYREVMDRERQIFLEVVYSILSEMDDPPAKTFLQLRFWYFRRFEQISVSGLDVLIGLYSLKCLGEKDFT